MLVNNVDYRQLRATEAREEVGSRLGGGRGGRGREMKRKEQKAGRFGTIGRS